MIAHRLRVLLIEDNSQDAHRIEAFLSNGNEGAFHVELAERLGAGLTRLAHGGIDSVLLDLGLPDSCGLDTFRQIQAQAPHVPIVVLSGQDEKPLAQSAVREGAQDYVVKGELDGKELVRALHYAVERKGVEEALRQSEQRYKKLLESVTDYIYTVQVANGQASATTHGYGCGAVTGYAPEEFNADPFLWYRMIHEEDRDQVLEQSAKLLAGADVPPLEHRIRHKNGSVRWIRNTTVVRRNAQGQVVSYDGLIVDVTEQKLAMAALRDSEALYQSLVENIPINMFRKNRHGEFTFANRRFCDTLGKPLAEIVGKTDLDFFPRELAVKYRRDDEKVLTNGAVFEDTERHQTAAGDRIEVAVIKTPVYDAQKRIIGTQGMFWDVTATKWAEAQKAQLRVARAIQQRLLPTAAPYIPHYDFGGVSYPAEACSGDYYDYIVFNDTVDIVIGDVSGHGFGPALLAAVTHSCLRTLALVRVDIEIEVILAAANRLLLDDTESEHFVTLVFARIDLRANTLTYSNAGHPAGLLLDSAGNVKASLKETGPLLGVFADERFPAAAPIPLMPGDVVLFVSDGVLEAMAVNGAKFGAERMLEAVRANRHRSAQQIVDALCKAIAIYCDKAPQRDDITAVAIKVGARG